MDLVVTAGDMRCLEAMAVASGMSYTALMERAGAAVADRFCEQVPLATCQHVLVLCGNGNNGGDGFVIARLLSQRGFAVTVLLMAGEPTTSLAVEQKNRLTDMPIDIQMLPSEEADLSTLLASPLFETVSHVIDAVYGIGFHGALPSPIRAVNRRLSEKPLFVMAVDCPSGVSADDGIYDPYVLCARETVTFTAKKPAAVMPCARHVFGNVTVASVGIPDAMLFSATTSVQQTEKKRVTAAFVPRPADSHKGTFGRLLTVCGSYGMVGAALLAGTAALRCGVGLLHMALPRSVYPIAANGLWEAVFHPLAETATGTLSSEALEELTVLSDAMQAVLVGCGLSRHEETEALLVSWLPHITVPTVIDADGLNLLSRHIDVLKASAAPLVLTPHPAEMARLLDCSVSQVQRDRIGSAKRLAQELKAVVVLKGHRTVIASPNGEVSINTTGCSGMATGGSGDVLAGMIASFAAQGMPALEAAVCGVYLHGLAGEEASSRLSQTAMLPTDMLGELGRLLSQFEKRE